MDDRIAKTEMHFSMTKETGKNDQISQEENQFQTALKEFQIEKNEIQDEKSEEPDSSEITVAKILATEPTAQISGNEQNESSKQPIQSSRDVVDDLVTEPLLLTTMSNNVRPPRKINKIDSTSRLAKISTIKKLIYQLAGDQQISDEYLIEIIYSRVKSSVTKLITSPFFFFQVLI